jgi:hypothetical protein
VLFVLYSIELLLRLLALGAFEHRRSLLRDPWNWIDVVVVASMLADVATAHSAARALQCLRPLRLASLSKKVQVRRLVCLSVSLGLTAAAAGGAVDRHGHEGHREHPDRAGGVLVHLCRAGRPVLRRHLVQVHRPLCVSPSLSLSLPCLTAAQP